MSSNMSDNDFVKNFSLMIGALIALAVVIFIMAQIIGAKPTATASADQDKAVVARIEPVGQLVLAKAMSAVANGIVPAAQAADGKSSYETYCAACHASGAAGAPKLGDKAAWAPRIAKGIDALHNSGLKGVPGTAMMAKGGRADASDDAVKAAVDYMVSQAK
jgi:cytochrome c5